MQNWSTPPGNNAEEIRNQASLTNSMQDLLVTKIQKLNDAKAQAVFIQKQLSDAIRKCNESRDDLNVFQQKCKMMYLVEGAKTMLRLNAKIINTAWL